MVNQADILWHVHCTIIFSSTLTGTAMSKADCISNRNILIIAKYLLSRKGSYESLFHNLPYPHERFDTPENFFMNEDEWTTFDNFHRIIRRARDLSGEEHFFFKCGSSPQILRSWGRFGYMKQYSAGPDDGYKRLPFFNSNINDTKEIDIVLPPAYDKSIKKVRVILRVKYHDDIDVEKEYIVDSYRRGIISSIPTVWSLPPADIKQPLNPYDPVKLFNNDPEFKDYRLGARMEKDFFTIYDQFNDVRKTAGRRVKLEPEIINGKKIFMGKYSEADTGIDDRSDAIAVLMTETVKIKDRILFRKGEIFKAPYFILNVTYVKFSWFRRIFSLFKNIGRKADPEKQLIDTINELRINIKARNKAYEDLKSAHEELAEAKERLEEYSINLEQKVDERTIELRKAREDLLQLNGDLEKKLKKQLKELNKYNSLRRYLSPKVAEKILSNGNTIWAAPRRKMMTVMFTDIRNFSTFTDILEPEELFNLLHNYISEMTRIVYDFDGTLNKIIGDGMLVFLGDPVPMDDHAKRAVLMGLEMQKKTDELKKDWQYFGHDFGVGIGINTGYMTVGNIGSDMQLDYTVIGNQVNVASRLESKAKAGEILVSQRTFSNVSNIVEADEIGEITVKGIHNPVLTYNVLGLINSRNSV
ncbi:adenylate/guanylate cyclase domain-containing protein [Thermodesulfobacteriota bacterium]